MHAETPMPSTGSRPTLLVASKHENFSVRTMDYALALAERMGADVLAASVDPFPAYWGGDGERRPHARLFASTAARNAQEFKDRAESRGIGFRHVTGEGKVCLFVPRITHEVKHIDFVLLEPDISRDEVAAASPVPVYGMILDEPRHDGETDILADATRPGGKAVTREHNKGANRMTPREMKRKAYPRVAIFGAAAVALYAAVFANSGTVMDYFTRGGFYTVLPVITVFVFSYVHGSFASNVWTALGVNASSKAGRKVARPATRKQPRPRATLSA